MNMTRRIVLGAAAVLFGIWMYTHWGRLTGDSDALIRFTLGILFSLIIMLRRKDPDTVPFRLPEVSFLLLLATGTVAALAGIIFKIAIVEWIGVLLLLLACSVWCLPSHSGPDLLLAFFILFWMHPLPGQLFGWLQGSMQRLSVMGSELILHAANVRVWGDAMVLHTGFQKFMVPEACSGMRTAVTVFLCTLGVGTLLRLKWYEVFSFVVLGLFQVLMLNIVRISYMVYWAPRMSPEWANTFLHDTLSIFLMGAILLVQLEASWWKWWSRHRQRIRDGIRNRELERPDKASVVPHSLRRLGFILVILIAVGLVGFGTFGLFYKGRAFHRKEMIREVADGLMSTDPDSADRAIKVALDLVPGDSELLSMQARVDFARGHFEDGLAVLEGKVLSGEALSLEETVLKSWAFMRLARNEEAEALIDTLPASADRIPGVAMLKAEFAATQKRPEDAARYIVLASRSHRLLGRIRTLFPYLAMHEQWSAIAMSDQDKPYGELFHALIAIQAYHKMGDLSGVARVMEQAIRVWPSDPRFLGDLYRLTKQRQGGLWEARFERNLRENLKKMSPDGLALVQEYCWRIARPDLAWLVFGYLQQRDVSDPALFMAPAQYGRQWYWFRRHQLGVKAQDAAERLNLHPVLEAFSECNPFVGICDRIPLWGEMENSNDPELLNVFLKHCLAELAAREEVAPLNRRLLRLYPVALAMSDRYKEAHARLDQMLETNPEQRVDVLFQHGVFYDQENQWQRSYEALREHANILDIPNLTANLLMIKAMMNLNLGVCAVDLLQQAKAAFPGALRLSLAESAIWDVFGFKEQALYVLSQTDRGENAPASLALLHETGRRNSARILSEALGVPLAGRSPQQALRPPPARWALARRWPPPLDQEQRAKRITFLEAEISKATSPYLKDLWTSERKWHEEEMLNVTGKPLDGHSALSATSSLNSEPRARNPEPLTSSSTWESMGRDDSEKVGALYQLAMLAAQDEHYDIAGNAIRRCLELIPNSPVLWRAQIALSEGTLSVVQAAYAKCPTDPEIWLANLVTTTRSIKSTNTTTNPEFGEAPIVTGVPAGSREAKTQNSELGTQNPELSLTNLVDNAISSATFSPGTFVRAGDFLLEQREPQLAKRLALVAIPKARGLLSAHVLGLRTALVLNDAKWAQACAMNGVENAEDPTPFYKTLVDIKSARRQVDSDLFAALEYLQEKETKESRWSQTLGRVYFQKGDMRRALSIFGSVIDGDTKGISVQTLILAAEAARRDDKMDRAISILEAAYARQPERLSVLNNLVYLLAQQPASLP